MQISQNLKLKQSQSLVMTPQLQQAIKLLQLNNLELTNLVNKELEENPFLENESVELDEKELSNEETTSDLEESFESGESISDEPRNEDYENRWDLETSYDDRSNTGAHHHVIVEWLEERNFSLAEMSDSYKYERWGDSVFVRNNPHLIRSTVVRKSLSLPGYMAEFDELTELYENDDGPDNENTSLIGE